MQNFINTTLPSVNTDEILSTNYSQNTQKFAEKVEDFAKVFNKTENKNLNEPKRDVQRNNTSNKDDLHKRIAKDETNRTDNTCQRDEKTINDTAQDTITNKNEGETKNPTESEKTVDTVDTKVVVKEVEQTKETVLNTSEKTQVLSADEVIQQTVEKLNNLIENALDGQLNLEDVEQIKTVLNEIQSKIDSNELVVNQETQKLLDEISQRLLTQNPKDFEVKVLKEDFIQLVKDIQASSFKTQAQMKMEEENANPNRALEMTVQKSQGLQTEQVNVNTTEKQEVTTNKQQSKQSAQNTKSGESVAVVSQTVKETQNTDNAQKVQIEQDMLDEMDVKIEEVFDSSSTDTNTKGQSFSNATDEIIKLQIQNTDGELSTPVTFAFDKSVKNITAINKPIQLEGITKELNANDILNQIGSKFEQLKDGSSTKITMTLRPNDLGRVTIELLSNANGITTNIIAQNSQVKELLDKNIDILKQQLAQQGINVQNVQVKTVEQNSQTGLNSNAQDKNPNGENREQGQNNSQSGNQNNSENKNRNFKFNQSNIIENIDFENNASNTTASINTLRGKISYNL